MDESHASRGSSDAAAPEQRSRVVEPVASPADPDLVAADVDRADAVRLVQSGPYAVFLAGSESIPHLLYEIGRLREVTFRRAGEGTGAAIDLDWFDSHYLHLVLWNGARRELVGAYRVARTDVVLPQFGIDGLYTSILFRFRVELLARISPALELGRAFVRPEYQKSVSALYLLWRGIGELVARFPRYRMLFGSVSISDRYRAESQDEIVRFLREHCFLSSLAKFVSAKRPVAAASRSTSPPAHDIDHLAGRILELEGNARGVPILVRQYVKLGGRFLAFTRDAEFCSLDALVLVDLARAPVTVLERYLGRPGCEAFLECHGRWPKVGTDIAARVEDRG